MKTVNLFSLEHSLSGQFLKNFEYPWEALSHIGNIIRTIGEKLPSDKYEKRGENIWISKSSEVAPTAFIGENTIIGENCEIRHCAFIRGSVLAGNGCVIGNSTEVKNSILFDSVQIPHYNYVGDSILGYKAHLGAGSITSNVKSDKTPVTVKTLTGKIETNLKKIGAMVGDMCEIGCGAVLCPGTVLGKGCMVYPLSMVRGYVEENSIFKDDLNIIKRMI